MAIWRMIRPVNLLIIAVTMVGTWLALSSLLDYYHNFYALAAQTLALCLLAAGGNVVNDIIDQESDVNNRKQRNPIGKSLSDSQGYSIYWILTLSGLLIALLSVWKWGGLMDFTLFLFIAASLWLYSSKLQQQVLIGNITVAILCTMPVVLGGQLILESSLELASLFVSDNFSPLLPGRYTIVGKVWGFYLCFAFALTLLREIIKDIEDAPGDAAAGYNTLAVCHGLETSKTVALGLFTLILISELWLLFVCFSFKDILPEAWWIGIMILPLPLMIPFYATLKLEATSEAKAISKQLKIVMGLGLCSYLYFVFL